jgi:acetyltransferase-like isoleucine patch superfamily enzyme
VCSIATLSSDAVLTIGTDSGFSGTVIAAATEITIGNNVLCGANTTITDTDWHAIGQHEREAGAPGTTKPIHISDGVFIGMNATILKGVAIGEGAIVAAGAVVTGEVSAHTLVAGNPARVVRRLLE